MSIVACWIYYLFLPMAQILFAQGNAKRIKQNERRWLEVFEMEGDTMWGQVRPFLAARFLAMPELSGFLLFPLSTPLPLV